MNDSNPNADGRTNSIIDLQDVQIFPIQKTPNLPGSTKNIKSSIVNLVRHLPNISLHALDQRDAVQNRKQSSTMNEPTVIDTIIIDDVDYSPIDLIETIEIDAADIDTCEIDPSNNLIQRPSQVFQNEFDPLIASSNVEELRTSSFARLLSKSKINTNSVQRMELSKKRDNQQPYTIETWNKIQENPHLNMARMTTNSTVTKSTNTESNEINNYVLKNIKQFSRTENLYLRLQLFQNLVKSNRCSVIWVNERQRKMLELLTSIRKRISVKSFEIIEQIMNIVEKLSASEYYNLMTKISLEKNYTENMINTSSVTNCVTWLKTHFEEATSGNIHKIGIYKKYKRYCETFSITLFEYYIFTKILLTVFPNLKKARNVHGQYTGIREIQDLIKPSLPKISRCKRKTSHSRYNILTKPLNAQQMEQMEMIVKISNTLPKEVAAMRNTKESEEISDKNPAHLSTASVGTQSTEVNVKVYKRAPTKHKNMVCTSNKRPNKLSNKTALECKKSTICKRKNCLRQRKLQIASNRSLQEIYKKYSNIILPSRVLQENLDCFVKLDAGTVTQWAQSCLKTKSIDLNAKLKSGNDEVTNPIEPKQALNKAGVEIKTPDKDDPLSKVRINNNTCTMEHICKIKHYNFLSRQYYLDKLVCVFCLETFDHRRNLMKHEQKHLKCKKCKKHFRTAFESWNHSLVHAVISVNNKRPFVLLEPLDSIVVPIVDQNPIIVPPSQENNSAPKNVPKESLEMLSPTSQNATTTFSVKSKPYSRKQKIVLIPYSVIKTMAPNATTKEAVLETINKILSFMNKCVVEPFNVPPFITSLFSNS